MVEFVNELISFKKIGFKNTNEKPENDPSAVEVYIYTVNDNWKHLKTFELNFEGKRLETCMCEFINMFRTNALLFNLTTKSRGDEPIQLQQIRFF